MTFLDNLTVNNNQLVTARVENLTALPAAGNIGRLVYLTTGTIGLYLDNGTVFNFIGPITAGLLFTQTTVVTIGNTVTETTMLGAGVGSLTIPANFFIVGKTIRISLYGTVSFAAGAMEFRYYFGGTVLVASVQQSPGIQTSCAFKLELIQTCYTTGTSGKSWIQGGFLSYGSNETIRISSTTATTINTTIANTVNITYQQNTSNAGNGIVTTNAIIEPLN